jgi:hypothetical protein
MRKSKEKGKYEHNFRSENEILTVLSKQDLT